MLDIRDQNQSSAQHSSESAAVHALERISNLLACINQLTLDSALGEGGQYSAWAAHHLGDMAKTISDETLTDIATAKGG